MKHCTHWIGGKPWDGEADRHGDVYDPATGKASPPLAAKMLEATKERGLLVGKGGLYGHTLRMAPPLTLTEADAKEGLGILIDALTAVNEETNKQ
jgi:4-aminobutyrate aminotransferase